MKIGITAGDPAGIGLEIVLKALPALLADAEWVLFATPDDFRVNLDRYAGSLPWKRIDEAPPQAGRLAAAFFDRPGGPAEWGRPTRETGLRAVAALEAAGRRAQAGEIDAIVTAPLSKQWAGPGFTGQTEFLAALAGVPRPAMAFFAPTFKVVLATTHLSLSDALAFLSTPLYCELIELVRSEFERFGYPRPRIAVAGVNPHAGEGGMFGREDDAVLRPAVDECRRLGIDVSGPYAADSVYQRAHAGEFDVVLAPYHDQGLIPIKLIAPRSAVNVTLGLPYVRTSPDHGTAFEVAGRGRADAQGMETALRSALDLVRRLGER